MKISCNYYIHIQTIRIVIAHVHVQRRVLTTDKVQLLGNQESIYGSKQFSLKTCGYGRSHCHTLVYAKSVTIYVVFVIHSKQYA